MLLPFSASWHVVAILFAVSLDPSHVLAGDTPVESVREKNRQNFAGVRSVILEERVELRRTVPAEARRVQEASAIEDARALLVKQAIASGQSNERVQQINDQMDMRYEQIDDSLAIEQLNASSTVHRTTTIDRAQRRVRRDDVDPRDLAKLASENRLGRNQVMSLDRTCSLISRDGKPEIQLHTPRVGRLATINSHSQISLDREETQLGLLPTRLFDGAFLLEVRATVEKRVLVIGKDRASGQTMVEATVDPEWGHAMVELRTFNADGNLVQVFTASEFRRVDGVWLPFETRSEFPSEPISPTVVVRQVRSARVNPEVADDLFAPPSDYRVVDLTGAAPAKQPGATPAR